MKALTKRDYSAKETFNNSSQVYEEDDISSSSSLLKNE